MKSVLLVNLLATMATSSVASDVANTIPSANTKHESEAGLRGWRRLPRNEENRTGRTKNNRANVKGSFSLRDPVADTVIGFDKEEEVGETKVMIEASAVSTGNMEENSSAPDRMIVKKGAGSGRQQPREKRNQHSTHKEKKKEKKLRGPDRMKEPKKDHKAKGPRAKDPADRPRKQHRQKHDGQREHRGQKRGKEEGKKRGGPSEAESFAKKAHDKAQQDNFKIPSKTKEGRDEGKRRKPAKKAETLKEPKMNVMKVKEPREPRGPKEPRAKVSNPKEAASKIAAPHDGGWAPTPSPMVAPDVAPTNPPAPAPTAPPVLAPTDPPIGAIEATPWPTTEEWLINSGNGAAATDETATVDIEAVDIEAVLPSVGDTTDATTAVDTMTEAPPIRPTCPPRYNASVAYVAGDEIEVKSNYFMCLSGPYEEYCSIEDMDPTWDVSQKQYWDDAWDFVGPCEIIVVEEEDEVVIAEAEEPTVVAIAVDAATTDDTSIAELAVATTEATMDATTADATMEDGTDITADATTEDATTTDIADIATSTGATTEAETTTTTTSATTTHGTTTREPTTTATTTEEPTTSATTTEEPTTSTTTTSTTTTTNTEEPTTTTTTTSTEEPTTTTTTSTTTTTTTEEPTTATTTTTTEEPTTTTTTTTTVEPTTTTAASAELDADDLETDPPTDFPTWYPTSSPLPLPACPPAYDRSITDYVAGDLTEVKDHIFKCNDETELTITNDGDGTEDAVVEVSYEEYCNIPDWDDSSTNGAHAQELWDNAWVHVSACDPTSQMGVMEEDIAEAEETGGGWESEGLESEGHDRTGTLPDCTSEMCTRHLTEASSLNYRVNADEGSVSMELVHDGEEWVGLAFSTDGKMIGSEAVIGAPGDGTVQKYSLLGNAKSAVQPMNPLKQTLTDTSIEVVNGQTVMKFTKLLQESGEIGLLRGSHNQMLFAHGDGRSELGYHGYNSKMAFGLTLP